MKNSGGFITVDYLFAFFLVSGFSLAIMTFSATLSMVEVVQYMTFASARNYFAGNLTEPKQREAAATKFFELKADPVIAPLLNGGWFDVPDDSYIVDFNIPEKYPNFKNYSGNPDINLFHGVIVTFNAKILDFQIPFFGSTKSGNLDSEDSAKGFTTYITSFLGREPSFRECNEFFNEKRWEYIKQLPTSKVGAVGYGAAEGDSDYIVINDNGC
ncbi:MAG: hypothetical protein KDD38_03065 [Bdellovibrionales bacterium]|nr:hypothetical protein [Bdellovibrionales bacterium]